MAGRLRGGEGKRPLDGAKNAGRSEVLGACDPTATPPSFSAPVTLCDVGGDDALAEMLTCYLDATSENGNIEATIPAPVDPTLVPFQPYCVALIEWGQDGYQSQAEVDFVRGSALTVTASYFRVKAQLDRRAVYGGPVSAVRCAAFVSYGTRPTHLHGPTRTLYIEGPVGLSTPVMLPPYTRSVSLCVPSAGAFPPANHRVEVLDSNASLVAVGWVNGVNAGQDVEALVIPGDARLVRVFNANVETTEVFRVICHLAF